MPAIPTVTLYKDGRVLVCNASDEIGWKAKGWTDGNTEVAAPALGTASAVTSAAQQPAPNPSKPPAKPKLEGAAAAEKPVG